MKPVPQTSQQKRNGISPTKAIDAEWGELVGERDRD